MVNGETISKCLTKKTKVIVAPHLYGYCIDIPSIYKIIEDKKILIVEDTAQQLVQVLKISKQVHLVTLRIFSFHSHKNISTLGEGGMLVVKDKKYADIIPMMRHNGHCDFKYNREKYWSPAMGNLDLPSLRGSSIIPNNYCLGEAQSALGSILLKRVKK